MVRWAWVWLGQIRAVAAFVCGAETGWLLLFSRGGLKALGS